MHCLAGRFIIWCKQHKSMDQPCLVSAVQVAGNGVEDSIVLIQPSTWVLFLIFITTVYPSTDNMTCSDILIITWHVIMLPAEWVQPGTNVYLTVSLMSVYELIFTPPKSSVPLLIVLKWLKHTTELIHQSYKGFWCLIWRESSGKQPNMCSYASTLPH